MIARLALEDGCVFTGCSFGASGTKAGEVVFNTSITGYQEVFTDPSYCGQIVTMTFPLIGNYGVNLDDFESGRTFLSGFVVKELPRRPSNHRATASLSDLLSEQGVIGLSGIDTRALTRRIRLFGAIRAVISTEIEDHVRLVQMAAESAPMLGANLVDRVEPDGMSEWTQTLGSPSPPEVQRAEQRCHVVVLDCGVKWNTLRHLTTCGCKVTVAPASAGASIIRDLSPNGLVISNGPGDPQAVGKAIATLRDLLGEYPTLGICLGHQLLALALGAETYKLKFGHHGGNQPVINTPANRVEITSQNHGFAVNAESLRRVGGEVTHANLNDGSLEGFIHREKQVLAVQFHPEASPGPHDSTYVIRRFAEAIADRRPITPELLLE